MAKLSDLQKIGILKREDLTGDYNKNNQYSDQHKDAISDGDVLGKGTTSGSENEINRISRDNGYLIGGENAGRGIKHQLNVTEGGGLYDIEGRNDVGGRNRLESMNTFNKNYDYTDDTKGMHLKSDDTSSIEKREETTEDVLLPKGFRIGTMQEMKHQLGVHGYGSKADIEKRNELLSRNIYSEDDDNNYYSLTRRNTFGIEIDGQVGW